MSRFLQRLVLGGGQLWGALTGSPPTPPPAPAPSPTPTPSLTGFYANGASAPMLKAMLTRVRAGTGRGKLLVKGDSLQVGVGAGTSADQYHFTGAAPNRPMASLASLYSTAGLLMLDSGFAGDGAGSFSGIGLSAYDPRVNVGTWTVSGDRTFAGAGIIKSNSTPLIFTPTGNTDTCEVTFYNAGAAHFFTAVDGAAGAAGTTTPQVTISTVGGFTKAIIRAASVGAHSYGVASDSAAAAGALCSMVAYDSTHPAVDIILDAGAGSTSADLAGTGAVSPGFQNLDHLTYVAPDLTLIEAGTNDMVQGLSTASYAANLQTLFAAAKASGDVLMVFPTPTSAVSDVTLQSFNAAAKAAAAQAGVPFFSLYEYYGPFTPAFGARCADGTTHPMAPLYAEIAGLLKQAVDLMAAA